MGVLKLCKVRNNPQETLKNTSEALSYLVLSIAKTVHELSSETHNVQFDIDTKRYSEVEMISFALASCLSFSARHLGSAGLQELKMATARLIENNLRNREPGGSLELQFVSRFALLDVEIERQEQNLKGAFIPGWKISYEEQCRILNVPVSGTVAVVAQWQTLRNMERWELDDLKSD